MILNEIDDRVKPEDVGQQNLTQQIEQIFDNDVNEYSDYDDDDFKVCT